MRTPLKLGQQIGAAKITKFLEEPDTGLAEITENEHTMDTHHTFTVPCWLLELAAQTYDTNAIGNELRFCLGKWACDTDHESLTRDRAFRAVEKLG